MTEYQMELLKEIQTEALALGEQAVRITEICEILLTKQPIETDQNHENV
jgi:hypothetical protein